MASDSEKSKEYDRYCLFARRRGIEPCSFEKWLKTMHDYDDQWEIVGREYDKRDYGATEDIY